MMVDHTYTDYSVVDDEALDLLEGNEAPVNVDLTDKEKKDQARKLKKLKKIFGNISQSRKNSGGVVQPFPVKLMEVLDRGDMEDSICWMPHGRAFAVLQPQVFVNEVLPRFFKQSKFMSFTRQLNLWGFKRITKGTDSGAYYHELFLRGRPKLRILMRRQKIKGTGIKLTPNPDTEPNFYKISQDRPLPPVKKEKVKPLPPLQQAGPSTAVRLAKATAGGQQMMNNAHFSHAQRPGVGVPGTGFNKSRAVNNNNNRMFPFPGAQTMGYSQYGAATTGGLSQQQSSMPKNSSASIRGSYLEQDLLGAQTPSHSSFNNYPEQSSYGYGHLERAAEQMRNEKMMAAMMQQQQHNIPNAHFNSGMNEQQEHQRTVNSALDLHYQANNLLHENNSNNNPIVLEDLKQRLLAAARALEHRSGSTMPHSSATSGIGGLASSQDMMRQNLHYSRDMAPRTSTVNPSTIMTALEQTQKVAAAAQEQSAILQRVAEEMNLAPSNSGNFRQSH